LPAAGWVTGLSAARCDWVGWPLMSSLGIGILLVLLSQVRNAATSRSFITACFVLAGLGWGCLSLLADARQIDMDATWQHGVTELSAEVADMQQQTTYTRLTLADVQRSDGARLPGRIWLYMHNPHQSDGLNEYRRPALLPGDRIQAQAKLHIPRNQRNPGGFDFESYCFDRHIALLGSATGRIRHISPGASSLELVRQRIRDALTPFPAERSGIIRALLLGKRNKIPEHIYDAFAATGAAHLLAISGLHIGMVAMLGFALFRFVLTRREAWIVNLPVRGLALLGGLLFALAYASLAGWPLPTQRAGIMLAGAALAWWLRAHAAPVNTLLAALMLILLLDATALASLSLWLSFMATAGLLVWAQAPAIDRRHILRRRAVGLFLVTLIASLVTLPLVAHAFGRLPTYSLPANLLMTPLYTLFVLPLSLLAAFFAAIGMDGSAHALFALAASAIGVGNRVLLLISNWPSGHLWLPAIPLWLTAAYVGGMGWTAFLLYRGRRIVAAGMLLLTLGVYSVMALSERPPDGTRLIAWDVGQGAATSLLLPGGRVMVVDVPGRPGSRFNGGTTLADGLRSMGLTHVDVLMISHAQSDHMGGALSLLRRLNHVGELWLADVPAVRQSIRMEALRKTVQQKGGRIRWLQRGDTVSLAGAGGEVLWPPKDAATANSNNASLVLRLQLPGGEHLLFAGDIEAPVEARLGGGLAQAALASDVMLMPHHGSRTSSTSEFLAAVRPGLAIAQTGFANHYGFPAPEVLRRYSAVSAAVRNTADGAVIVDFVAPGTWQTHAAPSVSSAKRKLALQWWRHLL